MKTNYKVITAIAVASACMSCAFGQTGLPQGAPPSEPRLPGESEERFRQRLNSMLAPVTAPYAAATTTYSYSSRSSSDGVPPVVIQFGTTEARSVGAMEEDLAVMTHIIDRALERMGEDEPPSSLGVPLYYTSGGKSVRALYLDGFGPLFMVKVNFPVHAPAAEEPKAAEKPGSTEWEDAWRAIFGGGQEVQWRASSSAVAYDGARVDTLKKQLIGALKQAANIKGVKAEESVCVTIFGSPAAGSYRSTAEPGVYPGVANVPTRAIRQVGQRDSATVVTTQAAAGGSRAGAEGTVLTLRAKKSDIDAAAKGDMEDEVFGQKVSVTSYFGNGHGLTSVNSWARRTTSPSRR